MTNKIGSKLSEVDYYETIANAFKEGYDHAYDVIHNRSVFFDYKQKIGQLVTSLRTFSFNKCTMLCGCSFSRALLVTEENAKLMRKDANFANIVASDSKFYLETLMLNPKRWDEFGKPDANMVGRFLVILEAVPNSPNWKVVFSVPFSHVLSDVFNRSSLGNKKKNEDAIVMEEVLSSNWFKNTNVLERPRSYEIGGTSAYILPGGKKIMYNPKSALSGLTVSENSEVDALQYSLSTCQNELKDMSERYKAQFDVLLHKTDMIERSINQSEV